MHTTSPRPYARETFGAQRQADAKATDVSRRRGYVRAAAQVPSAGCSVFFPRRAATCYDEYQRDGQEPHLKTKTHLRAAKARWRSRPSCLRLLGS
ncbi:unnamed protein product [Amoebophrya sp. A120]|nr:unnamed protein product [Amoebophrya sp. A120]|eukprot:GSA120T00015451001.1